MRLSRLVLAAAIAAASGAMAFAPAVNAADTGTITINGKVISQTCDVTGGAGTDSAATNFTVKLPVVNTSDLAAASDVAGKTDFSLALTNCPTTPTITVGAKFSSANANADGNLKNTAATAAAENVAIQLLDSSGKAIALSSAPSVDTDTGTAIANGAATLNYAAQYIATGTAKAGNVSTTVTYQITYE